MIELRASKLPGRTPTKKDGGDASRTRWRTAATAIAPRSVGSQYSTTKSCPSETGHLPV